MANIPIKETLKDKVDSVVTISEKIIPKRTIPAHVVPESVIPSRIKYPNKNFIISDVLKGDIIKIKAQDNLKQIQDFIDYTIPEIPVGKVGIVVINFRFKLVNEPVIEE